MKGYQVFFGDLDTLQVCSVLEYYSKVLALVFNLQGGQTEFYSGNWNNLYAV